MQHAPVERLIREAGAERVSGESTKLLLQYLEETAKMISSEAIVVAAHAGRKTIKAEDIELAKKRIIGPRKPGRPYKPPGENKNKKANLNHHRKQGG